MCCAQRTPHKSAHNYSFYFSSSRFLSFQNAKQYIFIKRLITDGMANGHFSISLLDQRALRPRYNDRAWMKWKEKRKITPEETGPVISLSLYLSVCIFQTEHVNWNDRSVGHARALRKGQREKRRDMIGHGQVMPHWEKKTLIYFNE